MRTNTVVLLETAALFVATVNSTSVSQWLLPVLASAGIGSEASYSSLNEVDVAPAVHNLETLHEEDVLHAEERQQSDKVRSRKKRLADSSRSKLYGENSRLLSSAMFLTAVLGLWKLANVFLMRMSKEWPSKAEAAAAEAKSFKSLSTRSGNDSSRMCHKLGLMFSVEVKGVLGEVSSERRKGGMTEQLQNALRSLTKWASTTPGIIALTAIALASTMAAADAAVIQKPVEEARVATPKQDSAPRQPDVKRIFVGWAWCPPFKPGVCHVDFTRTHPLKFMIQDPSVKHRKYTWHQSAYYSVTLYVPEKDIKDLEARGFTGNDLYALMIEWAKSLPGSRGHYEWKFMVSHQDPRTPHGTAR
ncbi:hypothetical protein CSUI_009370 [Cystoisospora suis]|uniref:Transmembrane protein n=1 Tax=Cystoisospora suis TaxID=483139 RepID=A0A2C6KK06_9APIC|nr:hypothetical protein CSUI_009370 [Cystoisospora suis]